MNKMRSLVEKNRNHKKKKKKKEPNRNPGAEEYNEKTEKVNRQI